MVSLFPANLVRIFFIYGCLYRERHVHFATSDSGCKGFSKAGGFLQRMYVAGDFTLFICSCMFCFLHCQSFPTLDPSIVFSRICCLGQRFSKLSTNSTKVRNHKVKLASWTTPKMPRVRRNRRGWRREGWRDVSKKTMRKNLRSLEISRAKGIFFAETTTKKETKTRKRTIGFCGRKED